MNIHYKIVEVWPSDHLIVARYWTDVITEEYLNSSADDPNNRNPDGSIRRCRSDVSITLPVPTPTGKELEDIIIRNAPSYWLKTLEDVMDPFVDTSMNELLNIRGQTFKVEMEEPKYYPPSISDQEIEKLIESLQNKQ
jgi:hypothetical protein